MLGIAYLPPEGSASRLGRALRGRLRHCKDKDARSLVRCNADGRKLYVAFLKAPEDAVTETSDLHHGLPEHHRNGRRGFDKYKWPAGPYWPRGLEIAIYDDGRVKVGGWHTSVVVVDVSSFRTGHTNASGHVVMRFQPAPTGDRPPSQSDRDDLEIDVDLDREGDPGTGADLDTESDLDSLEIEDVLADSDTLPADDLSDEEAYERACWDAIKECRRFGYDPTVWVSMIHRSGAVSAAQQLLVSADIQPGFYRLVQEGRSDLTVEWSALLPRWQRIFSEPHREAARWRLRRAGVEQLPG